MNGKPYESPWPLGWGSIEAPMMAKLAEMGLACLPGLWAGAPLKPVAYAGRKHDRAPGVSLAFGLGLH